MAETIDQMIADVIQREGKYTNDPDDKGGPTKYGITLATLATYRGRPMTAADVANLSTYEAALIYRANFYHSPRIDSLPAELQPVVFDVGVNSGPPRAVMLLQKALHMLTGNFIAADGEIGPQVCGTAQNAITKYGIAAVVNGVVEQRLQWYDTCVAENPADEKYLDGWKTRANSFRMV